MGMGLLRADLKLFWLYWISGAQLPFLRGVGYSQAAAKARGSVGSSFSFTQWLRYASADGICWSSSKMGAGAV